MVILRKAGFFLFVIAALAAGAWAYWQLRQGKKPGREAISMFPANALVYLESADVLELGSRISSRSMAIDGLRIIEAVDGFCAALQAVDSLAQLSPALKEQLSENPAQLAFYGQQQTQWLLCFNLSSLAQNDEVRDELVDVLRAVQKGGHYQFALPGVKQQLRLLVKDGVVLVSGGDELIGAASDEESPKLEDSGNFRKFRELHPPGQLLTVFTNHALYAGSHYARKLNLSLLSRTGFSGADVEAATSEIRVNGFVLPDSTDIFSQLARQTPFSTAMLLTALPAGCNNFVAYTADSLRFPEQAIMKDSSLSRFWRTANDTALYDVRNAFYANAAGCLAEFAMPLTGTGMVMTTLRDTSISREQLAAMSDSVFHMGQVCYRLRDAVALFAPLSATNCAFALIHNGYLYFASEEQGLRHLAGMLQMNSVMAGDAQFTRYSSEHIAERFNFLAYCSPRSTSAFISAMLGLEPALAEKAFRNFRHFSYSLVNTGVLRSRLHLLYSVEKEQRAGSTLWTTALDTTVEMQPSLFRNHTTGENEIVVQDAAGQLYLLSAKGEVLWKKQVGEKIIGRVHLVDAFRNNKLQMLFNTTGAIHLIDRKGNYVEGFPVKLRAKTTCALSVFDYENTRDYRVVLPCSDRFIYNYGMSGRELETFAKPKTDAEVVLPVQYANIAGREYLVAIDAEGRIYTFNRRGQPRGSLANKAVAGCSAFYTDAGANTAGSYIVYADEKNGLLNKVSFSDMKEIIKLGQDMEHGISRFDFADNNRFVDLVLCHGKEVLAYDLAGNLLYKKEFQCSPGFAGFYNFPAASGNYVFCPAEKELAVHDRPGNSILHYTSDAAPLLCDLFRNNERYMVYPSQGRLYCVSLQ